MSKQVAKQITDGKPIVRSFQIDRERSAINEDARTVELAFSSETPVERSFGLEVLDHREASIRLDRLKSGGAVLVDHDPRDLVGVIESVQIGADRVGRAVVRFGKSARASEIFQDVVDDIRSKVSVSYRIHDAVLEPRVEGAKQDTFRITDWEPMEISMVSIPADTAVGVGRSADMTATTQTPTLKEPAAMPDDNKDTPNPADIAAARAAGAASGSEAERKRSSAIAEIAKQYAAYKLDDIARDAIVSGMSVDEFQRKALEHIGTTKALPTAEIGMGKEDLKRYSIMRALRYLADPKDRQSREQAKFEIECSEAAAERSVSAPKGLIVPYDVLKRDLTVGTATAGGNLVDTTLMTGDFITLLRNALLLPGLGARVLTGLVGNIAIPRQTGAGSAFWVAESGSPTESQQAFDQVPMSPKTVGAFTDISRKLLKQSSLDVESFVQGDLAQVLGLAIQAAAITGGGANEPTGIIATSGIGSVAGGTNGAAPSWDNIVALETLVAVANADIDSLNYLTNAKVRGKLKTTFIDGPGTGQRVWQAGATPLNGYNAAVTNAVPGNLTKGTAVGTASAIIFGNFADLIIGMWGGLDILVDPYTGGTSGTVRVIVHQDVDVAIRHPLSFAAMLDALTA